MKPIRTGGLQPRSVVGGVATLLVAGIFVAQSLSMDLGTPANPGPGLWPLIVGVLTAMFSVGAMLSGFAPDEEEGEVDHRRVALGIGSLVLAGIAFPFVGFLLPALALVVVWLRYLMDESWPVVGVVLVVAVALWAVFKLVIGVPLPDDLLTSWMGI